MKAYRFILILCIIVSLAGCLSVQARYGYDTETDFSSLKTYAWQPGFQKNFDSPMDAKNFMTAMDDQLASKGRYLSKDHPDFLIRTHPSEKYKEVYLTTYGEVEFYRGKISIEFIDSKSNTVLWEGVAKAYLSEDPKPMEIEKAIYQGVEKLMTGFPPEQKQ